MKALYRLSLFVWITLFLFSACKKKGPDQTKFIPKNASLVLSVNTGSLKDKLKQNEPALENILRNMTGSDTAIGRGKQEWEALMNAGINLEESIYLWIKENERGSENRNTGMQPIMSVVAVLKDQDKFESYVKSKIPGAGIKKEKNYSYVLKDGETLVAWGKDIVLLLSQRDGFNSNRAYDSIAVNFAPPLSPKSSVSGNLAAVAEAVFNQKESESISTITEFADLAQQKADVTLWINSGEGIQNFSFPLPKVKELAENNFTAATLQFEEGKIVVNSKSYAGKALKNILKEYAGPEVNFNLIQKYPSNNVNGFMVFAFNPQIFAAIVRYMEVGALADSYLTRFMQQDFTLQQALSAFKGDIAVVVSDVAPANLNGAPAQGLQRGNAPSGKMILTATVGDATQLNKMLDRLVTINMLEKVNGLYRPKGVPSNFGLTASVTNQQLTIASDNEILNGYTSSNTTANKNLVMDEMKGKAAAAYLNIESILSAMSATSTSNSNADSILPYAKQTFKDIQATVKNFDGDHIEGLFELRFKNEKENSLSSLLRFLSNSSDAARKNRQVSMPVL